MINMKTIGMDHFNCLISEHNITDKDICNFFNYLNGFYILTLL
jgi:hypothetical protein